MSHRTDSTGNAFIDERFYLNVLTSQRQIKFRLSHVSNGHIAMSKELLIINGHPTIGNHNIRAVEGYMSGSLTDCIRSRTYGVILIIGS